MSRPPEAPPDLAPADREGSLEAPTRHALAWRDAEFYDVEALERELERVYDICHGCRRCFSLCNAFPTLFDAVDACAQGEVAGVERRGGFGGGGGCLFLGRCVLYESPPVPPPPPAVPLFPPLLSAGAGGARP